MNEDLTPCDSSIIDTWIFDIASSERIDVRADTVDAGTAADLGFFGSCTSGNAIMSDDDFTCTFPPPDFGCPQTSFVASGAGRCTLIVTLASAVCASAATANYQLRVLRNGADAEVALSGDDQ